VFRLDERPRRIDDFPPAQTLLALGYCLRPFRSADTIWKLAGLVLVVALLASTAQADDNVAGNGTVAEWRTKLGHSELATAAYAAGAMAGNFFNECKTPRTVRELHTYLLYRAPAILTMKQAIKNFYGEGDCSVVAEERLVPSNPPRSRIKATTSSEGP